MSALTGGFADPPVAAAEAFRAVLDAMARPGRIAEVAGAAPPPPLSTAAGVVALTLLDRETPVWLSPALAASDLPEWLAFHTGAPVVAEKGAAMFGLGAWETLAPLSDWAQGTAEYPDRSATLIVEMPELSAAGARLTGPGIAESATLSVPDPAALTANRAAFPLGVDLILTAGARLAALPRTVRVEG
ncbi:MAG: phosphonate C-P lyase system protein PhnH [Pseudomonadota bacterium]